MKNLKNRTPGHSATQITNSCDQAGKIQIKGRHCFTKPEIMLIKKITDSVVMSLSLLIFMICPAAVKVNAKPRAILPASLSPEKSIIFTGHINQFSFHLANTPDPPDYPLHPSVTEFVLNYHDKHSTLFEKMKTTRQQYLQMIEKIFTRYQIPVELKYIAIVESKLRNSAQSEAGAAGIWQFIPSTAELFGLSVTEETDERLNAWKSSVAAARYLKYLYSIYGDWLLVVASYNSGPGIVNKAIKNSGSKNFWKLQFHLPKETRMHVKKFIATHFYFEGGGSEVTISKYRKEHTSQSTMYEHSVDLTASENEEIPAGEPREKNRIQKPLVIYFHDEQWCISLKK